MIGVLFHVMTSFTLGLIVFPLVMFSGYLAFLTDNDVRQLVRFFRRCVRQSKRLSHWRLAILKWRVWSVQPPAGLPRFAPAAALGLLLVACAAAGVQTEYWMDPYHLRAAGGPLELRELDDVEVQRLLAGRTPIKETDKVMAVDMGTLMAGEHLLNRREEFRQGERVTVQVTLNPPHEDMWLECSLFDADFKLLSRLNQIAVPRSVSHPLQLRAELRRRTG